MPNLRLVPVNHADAATLTASSAALPSENLQAIGRTAVWRATGPSATLTAIFPAPVPVDSIALMTSNLTTAATWRIRAFDGGGVTLHDSGTVLACRPTTAGIDLGFGADLPCVNTFAFGIASQSVLWIPSRVSAHSVQIDLIDAANPAGYIEASRLVIGPRWEPAYSMGWGVTLSFEERGKQSRAEDGTLRSEPGAKQRTLKFPLDCLKETDRAKFAEIARRLGATSDFLISAFPAATSADLEADYTLVGKFIAAPGIGMRNYGIFGSQVEVGEV